MTDPLLVDHHVHGVVQSPLDRPAFELLINEGGTPSPAGTSHFDSPVGLAIRMHCAPMLDLEPGIDADDYLARRLELGPDEVNCRLMRAAGVGALLIDTGHRPSEVADPEEMAGLAGCPTRIVSRIESVAEDLAARAPGVGEWLAALGPALAEAAAASVGFKTIVAYRGGFALDTTPPDRRELTAAADQWFAAGSRRLQAPALKRHLLHLAADAAREHGIPIQAHAGFGDTDLTLHLADPAVFTPWVRELDSRGVGLVLLHCYPYHRNAGYLAAVYPRVSFDVGCMFHYTGASSAVVLAEALELASWSKLLYSSDAFGLSEFVYLGALLFRRAMTTVLGNWIDRGDCTSAIAEQVRAAVYAGNARRIYPLDERQ